MPLHSLGAPFAGAILLAVAAFARATPPAPDHIVIVFEENHSLGQIIGSPQAPFMNYLATIGTYFTNFYALTHPSQPNYLHFFSGSHQGLYDNIVPAPGTPYATPNLGAALLNAGLSFATYSEDMPFVGCDWGYHGYYVRRHNPMVNWQVDPPGPNHVPPHLNKPFFSLETPPLPFFGDTNAPSDYSGLPRVSIVIPNQIHNMHDGPIAWADAWLQTYLLPYLTWCYANNSMLIVTWDEDESATSRNKIPTFIAGPMIIPGEYPQTWTLHNLLRTIEDMHGLPHSGLANHCRSIVGCFATDPPVATRSFQQGVNGYAGAHDTFIEYESQNAAHGADESLIIDNFPLVQGLIRFDNIFGNGSNQIPPGVEILSAKLVFLTGPNPDPGDWSFHLMRVHRMLAPWSSSATWNSLNNGISANDVEAAAAPDFWLIPNVLDAWAIFDVSDTVQAFADNPALNHGWAILAAAEDGWHCDSSDSPVPTRRPRLEISYDPTSCRADFMEQPSGRRILASETASIATVVEGPPPLAFQWRKNLLPLADGHGISGATSPVLTISETNAHHAGTYDLVVSNACGPAFSIPASLIVCPAPPTGDINLDGLVNGHDLPVFTSAILAAAGTASLVCAADFSGDAVVNTADLSGFVSAVLQAP